MRILPSAFALALLVHASAASAELTALEITKRTPYAEGKPQGDRGAFEKCEGLARFAVDPALAANKGIVDLHLAPRNKDGKVEFWVDVEMWVPVDLTKANGGIFYDVSNRGSRGLPSAIEGGDEGFLLRRGFVVVRSGWMGDILPASGNLRMRPPVATGRGGPITGPVRSEVIVVEPTTRTTLTQRTKFAGYRPTERGMKEATLTVRQKEADPKVPVPRDQWTLHVTDLALDGSPWPMPLVELEIPAGFKPGWIYEMIYDAQDPVVHGAGLAGIRDLISFLRHDASEKNPLRGADGKPVIGRAISFGVSQSGRLLRQFIYEGFNADEAGRQVFDGIIPNVAGSGLGSFNHRFASPGRSSTQRDEHTFPVDRFPFTYGESTDPFTGRTDGILKKALAAKVAPKVFHTLSASEYWHRAGSLTHTDPLGKTDAELPENVRIYVFGGTQHGSGNGVAKPATGGIVAFSPVEYRTALRGLVVAMDAWVRDGVAPPASVYPKIADGTLVDFHKENSGWPAIPGVAYPNLISTPVFADRGPEWESKGIASIEPPAIKGHYVVRIPAFDADGTERGTLQMPAVRVPIGSNFGWNIRSELRGAPGELASLTGGYVPFAKTAAEARAAGDPRRALLERYPTFAEYLRQYDAATAELVKGRYVLEDDAERIKAIARLNEASFK